ncbi:MAG: hypothetical protein KKD73_12860 [Proteobacteria bacterium]|nr:hypothetical protein [Pseudomonadota bacterium]MBU1640861.1 hypothetical protein [Pseudomonadota bacterium]
MKIKRSQGTGQSSSTGKTKKSGPSSALDFRHLLHAQMEGVHDVSETAQVSPVEERQQGSPELRLQGVQMTEATIDSLESFAKALKNSSLNSQDLEPFITALEEENQGLLDIKEQLAADDPLTKLIEQVAAATYLETAKYRRGDYDNGT